jgi:hypothetical protein
MLKKLTAALCCVALLAAPALAAPKVKVSGIPVELPGIDFAGLIDFGSTGPAVAKASLNLRTLVLTVSAKGNVLNLAFVNVKFVDQDALGLGGAVGALIKDKYTVTARGRATYAGTFVVV